MRKCLGREPSPEGDDVNADDMANGRPGSSGSGHEGPPSLHAESSGDEEASRLSRRSSVLVDLLALFRRSSSFHIRSHRVKGSTDDMDEDEDDDDDSGNMTKEKILEAIRYKKEIIGNLKKQPWNMKRKRRTLQVARRHLQRQEAKVSRLRLYKSELGRRFTQLSRIADNLKIYLIPWEAKIKRIESHFGSVVSSYFTFLRWTLGVNIVMSIIMLLFVIIPEWLADSRARIYGERYNRTMHIKIMPADDRKKADELMTIWDFGGHFQFSLLFYGYYSRETYFGDTVQYQVPVAYFLVNLVLLAYSFFIILRKMAANARTSKLSSGKTEQYVFNWKTFTGWDFTIGNSETAGNFSMANVIKFRETIAEFNVKLKEKRQLLQIVKRVFTNIVIILMLAFSVWAIQAVSTMQKNETFLQQNAVPITVSFITLIFPNLFELIGKLEKLHPRTALRFQLFRVSILYILNFYTLILSLLTMINQIDEAQKKSQLLYAQQIAHYQAPYEVQSRSLRQILNNSLGDDNLMTTPAAPSPWTTVLSDFGPFGVQNPKAVVSRNRNQSGTVFISSVLGPNLNWNSSSPVHLDYPVTPEFRFSLPLPPPRGDLCWETKIGQEITKVITMDLLMTIAAILVIDFLRGLFVRFCNPWWFWNLEKTFPEYGEFKVAENVLHLVNNQGMIWLGIFFVPMLPFLNNIKLIILMYIRSWACMTCNVPAKQIFRASRSSNFYLTLLLIMLFLCTVPVGVLIASRVPSKRCGPFADQEHFYTVITNVMNATLPQNMVEGIRYMSSPGIIIPILLLLLLIIYFLFALVRGLKEANHDLSKQLTHERTEEKKKIFELAGGKKQRERLLDRRKKNIERKAMIKQYSSDEDSHRLSSASGPRSQRQFVPSLGSVSEVDHSDGEEEAENEQKNEADVHPPSGLTWKQSFLICIGLADRKDYQHPREEDVENGQQHSYYNDQHDDEEHEAENDRDRERRDLLHPERCLDNRSNRSRNSHSPRLSSGRVASDEEDRSARDDSFRTASRGSSTGFDQSTHYEEPPSERSSAPPSRQSRSQSHRKTPVEFIPSNGTPSRTSRSPRVTDNPLFHLNNGGRREQIQREDIELASRSSGSSVSQSHSLPAAVEIREFAPSMGSRQSSQSGHSDTSYKQAAQSLLEPMLRHSRRRSDEDASSHERTAPPPGEGSFDEASSRTPSDRSIQSPLAQLYANPHNSYTSAMMSPIMADYSLFGVTEDSESNDEHTHLLPTSASSGSSGRGKYKPMNTPQVRPPRFRISTSPPRKRLEYDSDSSQRRFEVRIGEEAASPSTDRGGPSQSSSPRRTPTSVRRNVTHTIV